MSQLPSSVLAELNLCRSNPRTYSAKLQKTLAYYKGNTYSKPGSIPVETEEGKANVQECINYLKTLSPLSPLKESVSLQKAAADHSSDLGRSGELGHVGSDGSELEQRIGRYAQWEGSIGENIDYTNSNAEDIVLSLLIDDGVPDRVHRKNILNPVHSLAGIAYNDHKEMDSICVIVFAENLKETLQSSPSKSSSPSKPKTEKVPLLPPKDPPKQFDPSEFSRPGYTKEDILELKEAFDMFDVDKSGSIDPKELKDVIEDFGLDARNAAIFEMVSEIDVDGSGKIEFSEFLDMIAGKTSDENSMEEVRKVFNIFDTDKTGFITFDNLKQIANDVGEQISDDTLKNLICKGDSNSDSLVSFEDFYYIMSKTIL
jgi:Ca2+-binding EF-hand superfamily protein/uncharacterized protein YkwD